MELMITRYVRQPSCQKHPQHLFPKLAKVKIKLDYIKCVACMIVIKVAMCVPYYITLEVLSGF